MAKHRREELTYQALMTTLRADIRDGRFPPGARLKVEELARRYKTSAMPVRQALLELQSHGLVVIPANRGASVRVVDEQLATNLYDLRKALLGLLVRRCAERASEADIDELESWEGKLDAATTPEDRRTANEAYFDKICEVSGNPEASEALQRFWPLIYGVISHYGSRPRDDISRNHREMLAAFRARDADRAVALAIEAVDASREDLIAKMRKEKAAEAAAKIGI